jgi:hypothetical protein
MRFGCALAIVAAHATAVAEDAATLRAEGEDFAKRGQYAEAIEKFKAADRIEPRAQHACMVGLAYLRREIWVKAELFLARCKQRARSGEPLPEWLPDAERQLADGLAKANVTTVNIVVKPATAGATVRVSGFAPDESFDPQTLHLPAGSYTLTITSATYAAVERKIVLAGSHDTVDVVVDLEAPPPERAAIIPPVEEPAVVPRPGPRGTGFLIAGASLVAAGVVSHVIASGARTKLDKAETIEEYEDHETLFDVTRITTFAGYGLGAAALGVGLYLRLRSPESDGARVVGGVSSEGGYVGVEWRR